MLWNLLTEKMSNKKRNEQGLWGLPDAKEIGMDLIVQMMDPGDEIQILECQ